METGSSRDTLSVPRNGSRFITAIAIAVFLLGCAAAWIYHAAGLTLSHYDAKAHLVVARRVFDSLTPGWSQMGALWLPLPHILNLLPVQVDWLYRNGASAVALSVASFALAASGVARIIVRATGSRPAALAGAAALALNPNLLYLQSTPMTEGLLFGLLAISVSLTIDWLDEPTRRHTVRAGVAMALACLTRYEAWLVTAVLLATCVVVLWIRRTTLLDSALRVGRLALYPLVAGAAFLVQSRLTVGKWFVSGGFFVPDNIDTGKPLHAVASVWWGGHVVSGYGVELAAVAGVVACLVVAFRDRRRLLLVAPLALFASGALPAYAFFDGHPFRIRYMTPLIPAFAVFAGCAVGLLRPRLRPIAAMALVALVLFETPPFDRNAAMVLEAQWDSGNAAARREVTRYLAAHYDGKPIMASMGSLAHYMQELSRAGLRLRDFLHEGNGDLWDKATRDPRPLVGWILIEEWAEGGDALATLARENPRFTEGFERVAEGGGVALYRATGSRTAKTVDSKQ